MLKLALKNNCQAGFTLLEIMLVLLLMGMISVGVVMTLPDSLTSKETVQWQAQRFATLLRFAEDEALISGLELGLVFAKAKDSYQFAFYDHDSKKWLPVVSEEVQGQVELPGSINIEYTLSGSVWDEIESQEEDDFIEDKYLVDVDIDILDEDEIKSLKPQVYVMSSGEVTPFTLAFSAQQAGGKRETISVSIGMSGAITFSELEKQ